LSAGPAVSASTWRDVDEEIWGASRLASDAAEAYARRAMRDWMDRVRRRTEEVFIPWYLDYWTQQWIAIKLSWYEIGREEGDPAPAQRLATYLQEEYDSRVLRAVARQSDPYAIRDAASRMYLELLTEQLGGLPQRFGIPPAAFRDRLAAIPAIRVPGAPQHDTSLLNLIDSGHLAESRAYAALLRQADTSSADRGPGDTGEELRPVAKIAADGLTATLAVSGGSAAAAAAVGGPAGLLISVGAFGWGAYAHERDRPALEEKLRGALDSALRAMWRHLVEDPRTGVTAPLRHMSGQIEQGVSAPWVPPPTGPATPEASASGAVPGDALPGM
jgi:hypothetical protein